MTGDHQLRQPAQRALDYLAGAHHTEPGGWRFLPGIDVDAATIGWQLATLQSGQLAGLHVSPETLTHIRRFLARSREQATAPPSPVTTAVGLAVELHLGEAPGRDRVRPAAERLLAHPPEVGDSSAGDEGGETADADHSQRDTYYWYYGSEAMFYLGGDDWLAWSRRLYPQLIESQISDGRFAGSWEPNGPSGGTASTAGGRLYVTAMNLLSLEIQNRHLPPIGTPLPRLAERPRD